MASPLQLRVAALGALLIMMMTGVGSAQLIWTGEGGDNLWDNPENWIDGFVPSSADRALINGPEAEGDAGPVIQDGMEAVTEILISDAGIANMKMTGGTLELTGWGMWWGDGAGNTATFDMSGGTIDFIGSPGIMELGWQDSADEIGSSVGIWNMSGGEIFAKGLDMPGKGNGGVGIINLYGGVINVGMERGGMILYDGAHIDVHDGLIVLEGDQTDVVEDYIGEGWITAFGGDGELALDFDGDFTTISATSTSILGDFNGDGMLDAMDIDDLTAQSASMTNPTDYDLTDDNLVNDQDINVWIKDVYNSWVGDADLSGEFNSSDLVTVLASGTYEQDVDAVWTSGDFNGNGRTDSGDLVVALADGGYEQGPRAAAAVAAVPEPSTMALALLACLFVVLGRSQGHNIIASTATNR